jgi:hypothetical protein
LFSSPIYTILPVDDSILVVDRYHPQKFLKRFLPLLALQPCTGLLSL